MNRFKKYCPNVWVAETKETYKKGDEIILTTKYGKEVPCIVYNLVLTRNGLNYYSVVRVEELTFAERKAEKYRKWKLSAKSKSTQYYKESERDSAFLSLGEPIKIGHHSEKRHRKIIERANSYMGKSVEMDRKANTYEDKQKYWEKRAKQITLANPESLEYFEYKLKMAEKVHKFYKENPDKREHSYSLTYAKKEVNEMKKKLEIAKTLWG